MKILQKVRPTPEQLKVISSNPTGISLIRGAAGSGKTTTALLMLRTLSTYWKSHFNRSGVERKPRILVLTYNRTLRGYIRELAESQLPNGGKDVDLEVKTFGKWSKEITDTDSLLEPAESRSRWFSNGNGLGLENSFLFDEIEYCMGRFTLENLQSYCSAKRIGRGNAPRMETSTRRRLIDEVILPYQKWKEENDHLDWNDLALEIIAADIAPEQQYDVIIADEAQDFSANQLRAIHRYAAPDSSLIFVLDAAQRIYPRGCTWKEAGITLKHIFSLKANHRNTREICQFATPLLEGLEIGDDGTLPDLKNCTRSGSLPILLKGKYSSQARYAINHIKREIDLTADSVAFLHPKGWFSDLKGYLRNADLGFVEITARSDWPNGGENIALSTIHSSKGLEFDHVFLLGLNTETLKHGEEEGDSKLEALRRMLAMAITRAKKSVILGTKPSDQSDLLDYLIEGTYDSITV